MLSALAKYIFGGVMGDAPETTTSMQYETREINDWLLVDMPDQDIDNEDMDSESDDDDILTAVPLLLAEEVSTSPRQIVLSYEPNSSCDKSCVKNQKGFQDKIHSTSSKVQVHTGDKIQGNFVDNVEAISLETGDNLSDKVHHKLSEVKKLAKSKQSKSKNSKPKKSKKNKISKKCIAKIQDTTITNKKKCNDDVQEKPNEILSNFKEEFQHAKNRFQEKLGKENECRLADPVENCHSAIMNNSSHKDAGKVEENSHITSIDDSSYRYKNVSNSFLEGNCTSEVEGNVTNEVPKNSDKKIQPDSTTVESNLGNISKRSYADVVKAKSDTLDKDCNKEMIVDEYCKTGSKSPEVSLQDKVQDIQLELKDNNKKTKNKKNKSKQMSNDKIQNEADIKSQSIPVKFQYQSQDDVDDTRHLLCNTAIIPPQVQENSDDEIEGNFNEKDASEKDIEKSNFSILDTCISTYETFPEVLSESYTEQIRAYNKKREAKLSQVQQNGETIQDDSEGKNEALMIILERMKKTMMKWSNEEETEDIVTKSNTVDFQNEAIQGNFTDDIYFDSSNNENISNSLDNCQILPKVVNDNDQDKTQDFECQENLDDRVLENIADLWDIYTKIQDNSDDEMNESIHESLQETSYSEMNENSEEQITDDEMNENSQDEYEEISDDEIHGRSCSKPFKNIFGKENRNHCSRLFQFNLDEESEESDCEPFRNPFILSSINDTKEKTILHTFKWDFFEELNQNVSEIPKHHSSCVPFTEYELVEYFNFEPDHFYACQSLQYPSSYALAIAEYYANHDQYFPKYSERCNAFLQKYKRRAMANNQTPPAQSEPSLITNTAELLEKIINQKCSVLPTKTAVILEHVKDLKPVQQAIQYEARKYLTRSQLTRQNRNYIYQSSSKTNRRRNLQRNHSGVNNNRKCC